MFEYIFVHVKQLNFAGDFFSLLFADRKKNISNLDLFSQHQFHLKLKTFYKQRLTHNKVFVQKDRITVYEHVNRLIMLMIIETENTILKI